ncbi:gliding motility-associated C-terminal domain-containing protein [Pedobacter frigoris]|uniref:gliding motility-associated C-terminal domain-containing protein n=1 Tax=Pedobacter frigoris TaxID=2571272 RepID=UPI00292FADE8|nr:gliding motility-associated C-terminal domain-containing protein [Pedobacter frigoris]
MNRLLLVASLLTVLQVAFQIEKSKAQHTALPEPPSIINAAGNYAMIGAEYFDFNFGEMVLVQTFAQPMYQYTQGFLQPLTPLKSEPETPTGGNCDQPEQINNVITPNGDGRNDYLLFRCLDQFPEHILTIYDRAGRALFKTRNYQNNWGGEVNGRMLNEDTYYFILELGKLAGNVKGFISIIHDQF